MRYDQLVEHFGGLTKAAEALGVVKQTVHRWKTGRIPSDWQAKIETMSGGKLRADKETKDDAAVFVSFMESRAA